MKIDFWRALGVTAAVMLTDLIVSSFVYGASATPLPLDTADAVATVLGAIVLGVFSYLYFKSGLVRPSAETGFYLGSVFFVYTFIQSFIGGYMSAAMNQASLLPPPALWVMWTSATVAFVVPVLVGWYLGKNK